MLLAASVCPLTEEAKTLVSRLRPSYHPAAAFSLSLDVGYLFLVGSSVLLSVAVQQLVTTLVLSQEMNACLLLHHLELEASCIFLTLAHILSSKEGSDNLHIRQKGNPQILCGLVGFSTL